MFRINLLKAFVYPVTSLKRLVAAWLVLPLSLAVLVPPILLGLGVLGTAHLSLKQGLGFTALVVGVCILVGAIPFTFLTGYLQRCRKRVIQGETTLPAWNDLKGLLADGGNMDTLVFILGLPPMICFWSGVLVVGGGLTNLGVHRTWGDLVIFLLGSGAGLMFLAVAAVFWVLMMFFYPIASLRLALGDGPLQALSPRGMLADIRKGWFDYLLCGAVVWAISMGFSAAQAACFPLVVVAFPVQVYLQVVWASLLGQYARRYLADRCPQAA